MSAPDTASPISRDAKSSDAESNSGNNNYNKSHSSREEDNDDEDTNCSNSVNGDEKNVRDKANYELHAALLNYIDDKFIPSIYGGSLRSIPAPLGYGGAVPRYLTEKPFYNEAVGLIKRTVLP